MLELTEKVETRGRESRSISYKHSASRGIYRKGHVQLKPGLETTATAWAAWALAVGAQKCLKNCVPTADSHPPAHGYPVKVPEGNTPQTAGCRPHGTALSAWVPCPLIS